MKHAPVLFALAVLAAPALAGEAGVSREGSAATPARLIEFTGAKEFLTESQRLRVWRAAVDYTLDVDAAGKPVACHLTERFRMNYVNDRLCEVLLRTHSFEPAHDASGIAVAGSYAGHLNYLEIREKR